jgi:hypothetical protein
MKILGAFVYLIGLGGGLTALSLTFFLWLGKPVGLPCHTESHNGVMDYNYVFGSIAFRSDGDSVLLAGGAGHTRGPFPMTMFDGLPSGSPMDLERCGGDIVRLRAGGRDVFELTQKRAEDNRKSGMQQTGRFAIFAFLAAILGRWFARRASDA